MAQHSPDLYLKCWYFVHCGFFGINFAFFFFFNIALKCYLSQFLTLFDVPLNFVPLGHTCVLTCLTLVPALVAPDKVVKRLWVPEISISRCKA